MAESVTRRGLFGRLAAALAGLLAGGAAVKQVPHVKVWDLDEHPEFYEGQIEQVQLKCWQSALDESDDVIEAFILDRI